MKHIITTFIVIAMLGSIAPEAHAKSKQVNLFYYYPNTSGYESLEDNYRSIDIFAPQIYSVGGDLTLSGPSETKAISFAKKKKMKVMPLVINQGTSKYIMSILLADKDAQEQLIKDLIKEAKKQKYIGWQFDFENIHHTERDLYAAFVKDAGKAFKKAKLQFSVAIVPRESDYDPTHTNQDWSSAYNVKEIAKYVDFISVMAYDNPLSKGPVASIGYVNSVLTQTLKDAPAKKISLGIPFYCWQWSATTGKKIANISYDRADGTKETYKDNSYVRSYIEEYETEFISFMKNDDYHSIWCDNEKSIEAKNKLAMKLKLHGTSAWALGQEDPEVWNHF